MITNFCKQFTRQPKVAWVCLTRFFSLSSRSESSFSEIFGMEHDYGTYNDALELWFDSAKCEVVLANEVQKKLDRAHF